MRRVFCFFKGHRDTYHTQNDGNMVAHCGRCGSIRTLHRGWRSVNRYTTV